MKLKLVWMVAIFLMVAAPAHAQQTNSFNGSDTGVYLSIKTTNEIIISGASAVLSASINNQSTNLIYVHESDNPLADNIVLLASDSGKSYEVRPKETTSSIRPISRNLFLDIPSGDSRQYTIAISPDPELIPGIYKLRVKRTVFSVKNGKIIPGDKKEIESNTLNVEIRAGPTK